VSELTSWLIVCDCEGHPGELVGAIDTNAAGEATVWHSGLFGASLRGANKLILDTPPADRPELLRKLKTREIALPATATFTHPPCGKSVRLNESNLGELLAQLSKAVEGQCIPFGLLCTKNGELQRRKTAPRRKPR
jgi:hypothetical protein